MADQATSTLGAIVNANPGAARVFEHHGLDYCCGGNLSLAQACEARGLHPGAVIEELAAVDDVHEPWTTMTPAELVDHLEATHHRYLNEELPRLAALAEKVVGVHGENHRELVDVAAVFGALRADLEPHLMREEQILFPMIRELYDTDSQPELHRGSVGDPIRVMGREHDQAGELLARLSRLTDRYQPPGDACASYAALYAGLAELEADTHLHIHKENNTLFPAAIAREAEYGAAERGRALP